MFLAVVVDAVAVGQKTEGIGDRRELLAEGIGGATDVPDTDAAAYRVTSTGDGVAEERLAPGPIHS